MIEINMKIRRRRKSMVKRSNLHVFAPWDMIEINIKIRRIRKISY